MPDVWHALSGTGTIPGFAIGQRALLVQTPQGNLLWAGITLIRNGGHYAWGTLLHWPAGANGTGVLLTGDIIQVVSDQRRVSFLYSYPNLIPLPAKRCVRLKRP
jgi:hypothetical protein